jgi:divalent metal cation (Fe/Co/Zn/Cd) transporter
VLHQLTGDAVFDGVGSIIIGLLMGVAAVMLISRNVELLGGKPLEPIQHARLVSLLGAEPEVECVAFAYAEVIGPERMMIIASVRLAGDHTQAELAMTLRAVEQRLMTRRYVGLAVLTLATTDG